MSYLYKAFGWVLDLCYKIVPNYLVAILLFALIIKIVMFPLGIKQQKNSQKQARLRPKELAIRKKYAGRNDKATQQKAQQEIMELYQKENYSMFGGCLPLLIQFPIIIVLYNVIRNPLQYMLGIAGDNLTKIQEIFMSLTGAERVMTDLEMMPTIRANFSEFAAYMNGITLDKVPSFNIGAFDLSVTPNASGVSNWYLLIPILTFVFAFGSMKLTKKFTYQAPQAEGTNNALSMKIMDITMPLFSAWIAYTLPSVIGVYWMFQNVLSTVQQIILSQMFKIPKFTEEDYKQAERELAGSSKKNKKAEKAHSLHHIDDDDEPTPAPAKKKDAPALKEDKDGKKPERKDDGEEPKVRSLHHIDDDDYDY